EGGTVIKINRTNGKLIRRFNPFGSGLNSEIFSAGPLTLDSAGNIYYNAMQMNPADPWHIDIINAWLVKIQPDGHISKVSFHTLTPTAPSANSLCETPFEMKSPSDQAPQSWCGSQRPALNSAPAVAADGTIYTVSRSHFNPRYGYIIAVQPGLRLKWTAS